MSSPIIFEKGTRDFSTLGLGLLSDALQATTTEELNGQFIFEMDYPADGNNADLIKENRIIVVDAGHILKRQGFVIRQIVRKIDLTMSIYAEHVSYATLDVALGPLGTVTGSAKTALESWKRMLVPAVDFTVDSDILTNNSTQIGAPEFETARQGLGGHAGSILDVWGGEYKFDNWRISLLKQRGKAANAIIAYGRNLTSFEQDTNIADTYTSVYPYYQERTNDNVDVNHFLPERIVNSEHVDKYPNPKVLLLDLSDKFKDAADYSEVKLRNYALAYIKSNNIGIPKVNMKISTVDLSKATGGFAEDIDLGDTVNVYFEKLGITTSAKIIKAVWNVLSDSYDKFEIGARRASLTESVTELATNANENATKALNQAVTALQSADSKTTIYFLDSGDPWPDNPKENDTAFVKDGENTIMYRYLFNNETGEFSWVKRLDTLSADRIEQKVSEAVESAQKYSDKLVADNAELIAAQIQKETADRENAVIALDNKTTTAINQAKSEAQSAVNALQVGGRNLFVDSKGLSKMVWWNGATVTVEPFDDATNMWHIVAPQEENFWSAGFYIYNYGKELGIKEGDSWTFSADMKGTGEVNIMGIETGTHIPQPVGVLTNEWKRISQTGVAGSGQSVVIYFSAHNSPVDAYIKLPKFEKGNKATDWTPAPEDVVLDYTNKDNVIKQSLTQYQEANDGRVIKAQSDATQALGELSTKVSQTTFNQKTGDLETKYTSVKQTADKAAIDIVNINQKDNVQDARMTSIENDANGTKTTVSALQTAQGNQSGAISILEQRANGFEATVTKVNNIKVGGANLFLDSKGLSHGLYANGATVTVEPFDDTTNMWHIVAPAIDGWSLGFYMYAYGNEVGIKEGTNWAFSADMKGTGEVNIMGIETGTHTPQPAGKLTSDWQRFSQTGVAGAGNSLVFYFHTTAETGVDAYIKLPKMELGNIPTAWTPAPEDIDSNISTRLTQTADSILALVNTKTDASTVLALLKDNWSIGIADNAGKLASGVFGDINGMTLNGKTVTINANQTVITGTAWINSAMIGNGQIGTAQIGDASITSAKISSLDVGKLTGNVSSFIQSHWNGKYASTTIDNSGMLVNGGNTTTKFDTTGAHYTNNSGVSATYSFGKWSDWNGNATSATGLYLGATGSSNSFINILGTNGSAALVLAGSSMDFGANLNVVQGALNAYVNVNIREKLLFKANRYVGGDPSYIEINENTRTFNFFTGGGSVGGGNYFWFSQNVLSAGSFSSTSVLSKKNVKSVYDEDALSEIAKTQLVNFAYKNRPDQNHVSPIIDDVNKEKQYYVPKTILGQDGEYVDMYSMISMAWRAIQQLNDKIGDK